MTNMFASCAVNVLATFGAVAFVDKLGRRMLLISASIWMFVTQVIVAGTLGAEFQKHGADLPRDVSIAMLVVCDMLNCPVLAVPCVSTQGARSQKHAGGLLCDVSKVM